ncbi:hypothetical protein SODALDRAFT_280749 [Sodiomyces alkalinus F11]|uniref:Uncharacterized protein n=1 Tax=Sodiomyces alkalinus (strain CBS 110278 / VKM F-3762 / F11) TaxID=1314773 RepID=A0A3N2PRC4_SODAK|nr:hypothetical protein SODALDRAFT_280749 [Sodiomyces alkalinus F11]ROT36994.1 hypothetical protein SODALDRAFT_280749 [Sodiomyces alkalinus F11]
MSVSILTREDDDLDCAPGQKPYRCKDGHFRGCCSVHPCDWDRCPDRNVEKSKRDGDMNSETTTLTPTTIASIGPPVQWTGEITTSSGPTITTGREDITSLTLSITTSFPQQSLSSPTLAVTSVTSESLTASPSIIVSTPEATETPSEGNGDASLSPGAMGAIFGAVTAAMLAAIVAYFLCGKRGKKLRQSIRLGSWKTHDDPPQANDGFSLYTGSPPDNHDPKEDRDLFSPAEGGYEEPQSRYTRRSAFTSSAIKNRPVHPTFCDDLSHGRIPGMATRPRTATPDVARNDAATPELQESPKRAAIVELASPGLPRLVEISRTRPSRQIYQAYSPGAPLHPAYDRRVASLRSELTGGLGERYQQNQTNGWTRSNPES